MSKTLLIIDDSASYRAYLVAVAQSRYPDWNILQAADALQALKLVREKWVDVVTLDIEMPGVDGFFLAPDIFEYAPDARIAFISGSVQPDVAQRAEEIGIQLIRKPVAEADFLHFLAGN